ncbi:phosphoadenylyl-sulfate reductase [Taibaiella koreensis]|uniref:phosphoadenylyl-sulfate reductase n=1 Tax=Taibaiella koreensis TaxID=1268548 RepID=UPI000E59B91E|nr:phosphoadenylyl-sulfate reductase [Taibaiella koreensis]
MSAVLQQEWHALRDLLPSLSISGMFDVLCERFTGAITFSTSFSNEDQVIIDHVGRISDRIKVFTLDTGRLFPETYQTWAETVAWYNITIEAYFPEASELEPYLHEQGPNSFYRSPEERKTCCHIRKVSPLKRALRGNKVWITGLRAEHSPERQNLEQLEWDEAHQLIKYHPLLHWTTASVNSYIRERRLPYNVLHDRGFASIGCAPCTRALRPGEPLRAGRWWWEEAGKKECGLHAT